MELYSSFRSHSRTHRYPGRTLVLPAVLIAAVFGGGTVLRSAWLPGRSTAAPIVREAQRVLYPHGWVECLAWSPDGRRLASSVSRAAPAGRTSACVPALSRVHLWQPWTGVTTARFSLPGPRLVVLAFATDGRTVNIASRREMVFWDGSPRTVPHVRRFASGPEEPLVFSPSGRTLLTVTGGRARIRDTRTGAVRAVLPGRLEQVSGAAFADDRAFLGTSDAFGGNAWVLRTVLPGRMTHLSWGKVSTLALSPEGRRLVCGEYDGSITLRDAESGRLLWRVRRSSDPVRSLAFSPDGLLLASGSGAAPAVDTAGRVEVCLWDARTGHLRQELQGHKTIVTALAFSPDGGWLASGSYDQTIRLWAIP